MSILSVVTLSTILLINADKYPKITEDDIINLRIDIRKAIDDSTFESRDEFLEIGAQPLIGSTVRLAFHDCGGRNIKQNKENGEDFASGELTDNRCNGCFDFDHPDNAGLENNAFHILEDIYQGITCDTQWDKKMSRADFWMAAGVHVHHFLFSNIYLLHILSMHMLSYQTGTISLEYAAQNQFTRVPILPPIDEFNIATSLRDIPYYFGREDCPRSPYATEKNVFDFPNAFFTWKETSAWFEENLGLTERETVVLNGAHTLGSAHADGSGFLYFWTNDANVLDNQYFTFMSTSTDYGFAGMDFNALVQTRVGDLRGCEPDNIFADICDPKNDDLLQWVAGPDGFNLPEVQGTGVFLNSDVSMVFKIEDNIDNETGAVSCTAPAPEISGTECPLQEGVYQIVNELGFDNRIFIKEFANVWEKMILIGEENDGENLQKLIVPYDRSSEDSYLGVIIAVMVVGVFLMISLCIIYRHKKRSSISQKQIKEITSLLPAGTSNKEIGDISNK